MTRAKLVFIFLSLLVLLLIVVVLLLDRLSINNKPVPIFIDNGREVDLGHISIFYNHQGATVLARLERIEKSANRVNGRLVFSKDGHYENVMFFDEGLSFALSKQNDLNFASGVEGSRTVNLEKSDDVYSGLKQLEGNNVIVFIISGAKKVNQDLMKCNQKLISKLENNSIERINCTPIIFQISAYAPS